MVQSSGSVAFNASTSIRKRPGPGVNLYRRHSCLSTPFLPIDVIPAYRRHSCLSTSFLPIDVFPAYRRLSCLSTSFLPFDVFPAYRRLSCLSTSFLRKQESNDKFPPTLPR